VHIMTLCNCCLQVSWYLWTNHSTWNTHPLCSSVTSGEFRRKLSSWKNFWLTLVSAVG